MLNRSFLVSSIFVFQFDPRLFMCSIIGRLVTLTKNRKFEIPEPIKIILLSQSQPAETTQQSTLTPEVPTNQQKQHTYTYNSIPQNLHTPKYWPFASHFSDKTLTSKKLRWKRAKTVTGQVKINITNNKTDTQQRAKQGLTGLLCRGQGYKKQQMKEKRRNKIKGVEQSDSSKTKSYINTRNKQ